MNLSEFTDIIMKNSVLFGITIAVLSTFVNQLVFSFINDIIMPIIDRDGNDDNKPDINKISDYTIKTNGITFKIGAFIVALIRFILLLFIIFILSMVLININKKNKI
jgi:large-conductance mechanosensitive channel